MGAEPGQGRKRCRSSLVANGRVDMNEQDHWLLVLLPQGQDRGEIAGSIGPGVWRKIEKKGIFLLRKKKENPSILRRAGFKHIVPFPSAQGRETFAYNPYKGLYSFPYNRYSSYACNSKGGCLPI